MIAWTAAGDDDGRNVYALREHGDLRARDLPRTVVGITRPVDRTAILATSVWRTATSGLGWRPLPSPACLSTPGGVPCPPPSYRGGSVVTVDARDQMGRRRIIRQRTTRLAVVWLRSRTDWS